MQIVIDITKELYDEIKNGIYDGNTRKMAIVIGNGIILPPDHGDLIDRKDFDMITFDMFTKEEINAMKPVIEADKESESKE